MREVSENAIEIAILCRTPERYESIELMMIMRFASVDNFPIAIQMKQCIFNLNSKAIEVSTSIR